jgi:NAD-dependent deacetylase
VMDGAMKAIRLSDLLIIGGTGLQVYPAASLVQGFEGSIAIINMSPTTADNQAQLMISAPIAQTLRAVDELLI